MDSSLLDYVAQASMELTEALSANSEIDRETTIINHIKKLWQVVPVIDDFKRNVEWVNTPEPLSLSKHCSDKIVVLDFWTYCCINCYHVVPDLEHLENEYHKKGLVVIGVHCAKFLNEKISRNILLAVQRYKINHPVVNDADCTMWHNLGIRCWPTFLILGPNNKPLFILTGEGHREELVEYVGVALKHFSSQINTQPLPLSPDLYIPPLEQFLKFPGNVELNPFHRGRTDEPYLAVSDTGNNRVILTDCVGVVLRTFGGPESGYQDGDVADVKFNAPHGLCWLSQQVVAVCDTNNHALRALHIDEGRVETLAGPGLASADTDGDPLCTASLRSPWDVALFTTPDLDMTVRPPPPAGSAAPAAPAAPPPPPPLLTEDKDKDKTKVTEKDKREKRRVLLIACAGSHQIWAMFLDNTIWWRYKSYPEGTCTCIAGTGVEAARNSSYPNTVAFAQPSGLAVRGGANPEVFIADSESSSIRRMALTSGQVTSLCGGDRNPLNLFAFGDVDEVGMKAKFQHPLGLAYHEATNTLYVADTYNNKIKKLEVGPQRVSSLYPTKIDEAEHEEFREPSDVSITADGKYLFVADTNNHCVKSYNLVKNICTDFNIRMPEPKYAEPENLILYKNDLFVNRKFGTLIIYFNVSLEVDTRNVKFTPGAPQNWHVCVRDETQNDVTLEDFEFAGCSNKGSKLPGRVEMRIKNKTQKTHYRLYLSFQTALCDNTTCFSHSFTIRSSILVRDSVKMIESYKITCKVNPINRENKTV